MQGVRTAAVIAGYAIVILRMAHRAFVAGVGSELLTAVAVTWMAAAYLVVVVDIDI